jgi:hypothetical protein
MTKIILLLLASLSLAAQTSHDGPKFTADGQAQLPNDYREWVFLSSGLGMTYGPAASADQGNPKFENVFVNPASYRAFVATGKWPDRTMFILEIRRAAEKGSINNAGRFQSDVIAIEAEVKDEARFPQKWAYFEFGRNEKAKPLAATSSCNACHSQNAAVENTFVQFYPTLLDIATHKGTLKSATSAP